MEEYNEPPQDLIDYILSDECKGIAVLSGAGISVSAGIPDFRSPGGMYDTLRPELLTATTEQQQIMEVDPTAVVECGMFFSNQFPYLEVRKPFIIGTAEEKWKATPSHWFLRLLHDKQKLLRLYTQNIDGLDLQVGIPNEKIINVHGTIGSISCENCGVEYPRDDFMNKLKSNIKDIYGIDETAPKESKNILCLKCEQPTVKPSTVLYGSSLPSNFFTCVEEDFPDNVDLLLVIGTSLTVYPAAGLVDRVSPTCRRVLVNRDNVVSPFGSLGVFGKQKIEQNRNYFLKGNCDEVIEKLVNALGWKEDFNNLLPKKQ